MDKQHITNSFFCVSMCEVFDREGILIRDCVMGEVIQDQHEALNWVSKNVVQVIDINPDGNYGYWSFIEACNCLKRKDKVNLHDVDSSKEIILNRQKDMKKGCHKNDHLFVQGNWIEYEPSIGCGVNVNAMQYSPHFNFKEKIQEHPNNSTYNLELFDAAKRNKIYIATQRDSGSLHCPCFHCIDSSKYL